MDSIHDRFNIVLLGDHQPIWKSFDRSANTEIPFTNNGSPFQRREITTLAMVYLHFRWTRTSSESVEIEETTTKVFVYASLLSISDI